MPAPLQVKLTVEEETTLRELSLADGVPRRTRQRAMAVGLNRSGWTVGQIAQHLQMHEHTVRSAMRRWQSIGLYRLWEKRRPGRQRQWQAGDRVSGRTLVARSPQLHESATVSEISR